MKSATKTVVMSLALFGAALSVFNNARAADTNNWFEQQLQISDGYYPQYKVQPRVTKPASPQALLQDREFDLERASDSNGSKPVPIAQAARSLEQTAQAPAIKMGSVSADIR